MSEQKLIKIPFILGAKGESAITLINATFIATDGPDRKYPDPDFGEWLMTTIMDEFMVYADVKGLVKHKYYCPDCGQELNIESRQADQFEYDIQYKEFPPFMVKINIPCVECPKCKNTCGIDTKGNGGDLVDAIIQALDSEHIKP